MHADFQANCKPHVRNSQAGQIIIKLCFTYGNVVWFKPGHVLEEKPSKL